MKKTTGIFGRGDKLWMKLKVGGEWKNLPTPYRLGDEAEAKKLRDSAQERLDAGQDFTEETGVAPTIRAYGEKLVKKRRELGVASWSDDSSRLKTHVYPSLGDMKLDEVKPRHINSMIQAARAKKKAPRTVRNIYSICSALFRTASIEGLIDTSPCILTKYELGKVRDARSEWRQDAIFTREELEQLISDPRIPEDRRLVYGLLGVAGLRHGEAAGLRWRHYVPGLEPLGRLVVATSYDKGKTKSEQERWMPVHPVLAAMLAEWRLSGWPREFGQPPKPDDLIVPHPKPSNRGRRVEEGGMRSDSDSYKRLRADCDSLGLRRRRVHDLRRTLISLARTDGAERDVLRLCTHGPGRDVMEMYTTFGWPKLCAQISVLKVERRAALEPAQAVR